MASKRLVSIGKETNKKMVRLQFFVCLVALASYANPASADDDYDDSPACESSAVECPRVPIPGADAYYDFSDGRCVEDEGNAQTTMRECDCKALSSMIAGGNNLKWHTCKLERAENGLLTVLGNHILSRDSTADSAYTNAVSVYSSPYHNADVTARILTGYKNKTVLQGVQVRHGFDTVNIFDAESGVTLDVSFKSLTRQPKISTDTADEKTTYTIQLACGIEVKYFTYANSIGKSKLEVKFVHVSISGDSPPHAGLCAPPVTTVQSKKDGNICLGEMTPNGALANPGVVIPVDKDSLCYGQRAVSMLSDCSAHDLITLALPCKYVSTMTLTQHTAALRSASAIPGFEPYACSSPTDKSAANLPSAVQKDPGAADDDNTTLVAVIVAVVVLLLGMAAGGYWYYVLRGKGNSSIRFQAVSTQDTTRAVRM